MSDSMKAALVVVDVQYDFLPHGSLAVPGGDKVIEPINQLLRLDAWTAICATQDYHPANHVSFRSNHEGGHDEIDVSWQGQTQRQKLWPDHCVQGKHGCKLHADLALDRLEKVFRKGYNSALDSYSGFIDSFRHEETGLDAYLKGKQIDTVYVCGVAEDFCVFHTALEAGCRGYKTIIVEEAVAGIAALRDDQKSELASNKVIYQDLQHVLDILKA